MGIESQRTWHAKDNKEVFGDRTIKDMLKMLGTGKYGKKGPAKTNPRLMRVYQKFGIGAQLMMEST